MLLIAVPTIILISDLGKTDFDKYGQNNNIICCALIVLIICGSIGLKNSLPQQKEQNIYA